MKNAIRFRNAHLRGVGIFIIAALCFVCAPRAHADEGGVISTTHRVLMYLPNRVFDLVDIVRLRARVGPGLAVGARATAPASVFFGSYASVFAGLPGPRMEHELPVPAGVESLSGIQVSAADASIDGGVGPQYSPSECGASVHLLLVGVDLDIDAVEIADFVVGFIGADLRADDI